MKFRKKPVVIEAVQWNPGPNDVRFTFPDGTDFLVDRRPETTLTNKDNPVLLIGTLEGTMEAQAGDWIIRGVKGEYYPCKPDIFEATYEFVEEATA